MKCPICNETCELIRVISPTDENLLRCSECGSLGTARVWDALENSQSKLIWCRNEIQVIYVASQERIADLLGQLGKLNEQWQYWRDTANTYAHSLEERENKIIQLRAEITGLRSLES